MTIRFRETSDPGILTVTTVTSALSLAMICDGSDGQNVIPTPFGVSLVLMVVGKRSARDELTGETTARGMMMSQDRHHPDVEHAFRPVQLQLPWCQCCASRETTIKTGSCLNGQGRFSTVPESFGGEMAIEPQRQVTVLLARHSKSRVAPLNMPRFDTQRR